MGKQFIKFISALLPLFVLVGCANNRLENFASDAKKVIDPINLQNWAVEFLKTNSNSGIFDNKLVPLEIQNLNSQGSPFEFASSEKDRIYLNWGGGFGHWGIIVGSKEFKLKTDSSCIKWESGIYFFDGP